MGSFLTQSRCSQEVPALDWGLAEAGAPETAARGKQSLCYLGDFLEGKGA